MDRKPKLESTPGPSGDAAPAADSPAASTSSYTDFTLRATAPSSLSGWKHNVMKFSALGDRVVDPSDEGLFMRPVKLNRKDPRTVRRLTDEDRERHNQRAIERAKARARAQGMDVDVKPEDGADGAVKGEGDEDDDAASSAAKAEKEELDFDLVGKGAGGSTNVQRRGPGGMFKKKTRRVFVSSEEARRLKREEWQPWVLEDDEGRERWIGRLEGGAGESDAKGGKTAGGAASGQGRVAQAGQRSAAGLEGWRPAAEASATGGGGSAYVAFVFGDNGDEFQVVPVNRWYRFNQGPKYLTLAEEEAEAEYARQQKSKDPERWVMHRRAAPAVSSSGASTPRASGSSSGGGAPSASAIRSRMMANSAQGVRVDPDDAPGRGGPGAPRAAAGGGARGRARGGDDRDDDEFDFEEDFQDDEEGIAKIDDLADEEEAKELEERIRREMRAVERADEIPDEAEDDEAVQQLTGTGKEIKKLVKKSDKTGAYDSEDEEENPYASDEAADSDDAASVTSAGAAGSRAASPQPSASRPSSVSRPQSRAGSPAVSGSAHIAKRATSPSGASTKRKRAAGEGGAGSDSETGGDGSKRRKAGKGKSPSPGPVGVLTQDDLIAYLKTRPGFASTTKEVLTHFRRAIKGDARNKQGIGALLQAVANLKEGNLVLKPGL
ncbi:hypothetical protein Rhopal_000977-T1 [Rhodotorula paludigena]|uniref:Transcription initiation factor IIF subunit alpha n=1 Tax=Rhodotorula paludigena TaxID=86838 RepID=A0AAV5G632_9BASI|nr:hypothetical protein Rhopal_000977-T1 [Rhodotorula paludigena]